MSSWETVETSAAQLLSDRSIGGESREGNVSSTTAGENLEGTQAILLVDKGRRSSKEKICHSK